jgi:hypothetical protein
MTIPSTNQSNVTSTNSTPSNNVTNNSQVDNSNTIVISSVNVAPITVQSPNGLPNEGNN